MSLAERGESGQADAATGSGISGDGNSQVAETHVSYSAVKPLFGEVMHESRSVVLLLGLVVLLLGCGAGKEARSANYAGEADYASAQAPQSSPAPAAAEEASPADGGSGYGYQYEAGVPGGGDERLAQAPPPSAPGAAPGAEPPAATQPGPPSTAIPDAVSGPLLIYEAKVQIAVFEADKALTAAEKLAREAKGYLVRRADRSITFRVPAERFQAVLEQVLELGDVLHREVQARDVTDEFYDTQTRLRTLHAMRDRLEDLLRRAQKVEEALAVERELGRIVEQIEQAKGRLKLLQELIAFSTITIEFQPRNVETIESRVKLPFPWLDQLGLGPLLSL